MRYAKALREDDTRAKTEWSGDKARALTRGARQRAVLALSGLKEGMTAQQIAEGAHLPPSNVYSVLNRLVNSGWLVESADEPRRWRTNSPE